MCSPEMANDKNPAEVCHNLLDVKKHDVADTLLKQKILLEEIMEKRYYK